MTDATEAARRIIEIDDWEGPDDRPDIMWNEIAVVARALLSARDAALEEAAKVAHAHAAEAHCWNADRYFQSRRIENAIRALRAPAAPEEAAR